MRAIARRLDKATCPGCLPRSLVFIAWVPTQRTFSTNRPIATVGSRLSRCRAITTEGSLTMFVENRPVHRVGDRNNCGGRTIGGDPRSFVGN